jgi:hypothetical protein
MIRRQRLLAGDSRRPDTDASSPARTLPFTTPALPARVGVPRRLRCAEANPLPATSLSRLSQESTNDLNEHLCLDAARPTGLVVAHTRVGQFDEESTIVVDRYDRRSIDGQLARIHREDLCQALGAHPDRKYQNEGGPGPRCGAAVEGSHRSATLPLPTTALAVGRPGYRCSRVPVPRPAVWRGRYGPYVRQQE